MSRCWLTGAGSGIGAALAEVLLDQGHKVALGARTAESVEALKAQHPRQTLLALGDITDRQQVEAIVEDISEQWGALDLVILNAGTCEYLEPGQFDSDTVERVMRTNLLGTSQCLQAALPLLRRGQRPHLVVVASSVAWLALPRAAAYGASKAAVKLFSEGLRSELLDTNVRVSVVFPGAIATNITVNSGVATPQEATARDSAKFKTLSAAKAAEIIIDGMEKNKYHILVGQDAKMMDFLSRVMPDRAAKIIFSQMRSLLG